MGLKLMLDNFEQRLGFQTKIKWLTVFYIVSYQALGLYWCWHYAFPVKAMTVLFACVTYLVSGIGVTGGVHRLFTHRSYKANTALKIFLVICFCTAGQNTVCQWVRDHRAHHKFSDTEADPHNSKRGLFFSHIGWLMLEKNEELKKQGKKIDMSDIENDKVVMFQEKYNKLLITIFCYILPVTLNVYLLNEGWKCAVAWQCFIRFWAFLHAELTVNSLAHVHGYKPYDKTIKATETRFVSTITFGEGWHNYHHTFPFDYRASEYFDYINGSTLIINFWAKMGWAYDLKVASPEMISKVKQRIGDGTDSDSFEKYDY